MILFARATMLAISLALAACQSSSPTGIALVHEQAIVTQGAAETDICLSRPSLYGALVVFSGRHGGKPAFYSSAFYPVNCGGGNPWEPRIVDGHLAYKLYFVLADGRKLLFGVDNHPLTVPTSEGPLVDVGTRAFWTFVIEGQGTTFPLYREPHYHDALMLIELWGPGGKIAEAYMTTDEEPSQGPRGPKDDRQ
jgi:hypothetical protein